MQETDIQAVVLGNNSIKRKKRKKAAEAGCHQNEKALQKSGAWTLPSHTELQGLLKDRRGNDPLKSNMEVLDVFLTSVHSIWKSECFPAIGGLYGHYEK